VRSVCEVCEMGGAVRTGGRDGMDKTVYRAGWKEQLDREL
jgi:hypothetical protein